MKLKTFGFRNSWIDKDEIVFHKLRISDSVRLEGPWWNSERC